MNHDEMLAKAKDRLQAHYRVPIMITHAPLEGSRHLSNYTIWFDGLRFESLPFVTLAGSASYMGITQDDRELDRFVECTKIWIDGVLKSNPYLKPTDGEIIDQLGTINYSIFWSKGRPWSFLTGYPEDASIVYRDCRSFFVSFIRHAWAKGMGKSEYNGCCYVKE